jgi:Na+/H+ antiporter NhaD/arsenite permease-like protein
VSAVLSALLDNVAFTATMVPVIMQLAESVGEIWRMLTYADEC